MADIPTAQNGIEREEGIKIYTCIEEQQPGSWPVASRPETVVLPQISEKRHTRTTTHHLGAHPRNVAASMQARKQVRILMNASAVSSSNQK
jgi:hypothetical protein